MSSREPGKAGRTGRLSRKGLDHWTQDWSIISALPTSHDLENVVGVSNTNLERDTLGTMQTEGGENEPGSHLLSSPSLPAFNLSQHQSL